MVWSAKKCFCMNDLFRGAQEELPQLPQLRPAYRALCLYQHINNPCNIATSYIHADHPHSRVELLHTFGLIDNIPSAYSHYCFALSKYSPSNCE